VPFQWVLLLAGTHMPLPITVLNDFLKWHLQHLTRKSYRASVAQCKVLAYARSCRRCVGFKNGFHQWIQRIFVVVVEAKKFFSENFFLVFNIWMHFTAL